MAAYMQMPPAPSFARFGMAVVRERMHIAPQNLGRWQANHASARGVDEGAAALGIDAKHALPGRIQQLRRQHRQGV